jgi:hypothetical protein
MLRAILCLCVLFLLSAERAEAGVVNCPTTLTLNPNLAPSSAIGSSYAAVIVGNDLVCQFAPISFESSPAFRPAWSCPSKSASAAVSGGSGSWKFGSPGSSKMVDFGGHLTLVWRPSFHGMFAVLNCVYEELTPPVVAVWHAAPKNTICTVNPFNRGQFNCVLPACLQTLTGSNFPTAPFSPPGPGYTNDSAIINVANGQLVVAPAAVNQVKSKMGAAAFNSATFSLIGGPGSDSTLPAGVITCSYDGPGFQSAGKTLKATITVACTGSCGSL